MTGYLVKPYTSGTSFLSDDAVWLLCLLGYCCWLVVRSHLN